MTVQRRKVLKLLACATGLASTRLAAQPTQAAQQAPSPAPSQAAKPTPPPASTYPATSKEKVLGIGGFFFRAKDPQAIALWYQEHLGIAMTPQKLDDPVWTTDAGTTSFTPFSEKSKYLGDPQQQWMLNFRVANLDRIVQQLQAAGIAVKVDPETYPYGRFARTQDPEGNPIELWQPMTPAAK